MHHRQVAVAVLLALTLQPVVALAEPARPGVVNDPAPVSHPADPKPAVSPAPPPPPIDASAFATIPVGKRIRVERDHSLVEGTFERFVADTLWLQSTAPAGPKSIPAASIDGLWKHGSNAGRGALIGAGIVGALGLLAGAALSSAIKEGSASGSSDPVIAGFVGGAAIGALLGAAIGSGGDHWQRAYP